MRHSLKGFSLVEILVTLAVVAILATFSSPFGNLIAKTRAESALATVRNLVSYARAESVTQGVPITLCGTTADGLCTKEWGQGDVLVFVDINQDGHFDETNERLVRRVRFDNRIVWAGSNSKYMRFQPEGHLTKWGTYTYCEEPLAGMQLVFNRFARSYQTSDTKDRCHAEL